MVFHRFGHKFNGKGDPDIDGGINRLKCASSWVDLNGTHP